MPPGHPVPLVALIPQKMRETNLASVQAVVKNSIQKLHFGDIKDIVLILRQFMRDLDFLVLSVTEVSELWMF